MPGSASASGADPKAQEAKIHKNAQQFARLLVREIKLYNQAKISEGRQHKDLYSRLKNEIEKSRASYDKRYCNTVAARGDYFTQEVIKALADNDVALMGSGFLQ